MRVVGSQYDMACCEETLLVLLGFLRYHIDLVLLMDCLSIFPLDAKECAENPSREPRNEHFLRNVAVQPSSATPLTRPSSLISTFSLSVSLDQATAITCDLSKGDGDASLIDP